MTDNEKHFVKNAYMETLNGEAYDYVGLNPHFYPSPRLVAISHVRSSKSWQYGGHTHEDHEWVLIRKGKVRYCINDIEFFGDAGHFYFVQPGQTHSEVSVVSPLDFFVVKFRLVNFKGDDVLFLPPPFDILKQRIDGLYKILNPLYIRMFTEIKEQKPWFEEIVESIISQLTWIVRRRLYKDLPVPEINRVKKNQVEIVTNAKTYLMKNLSRSVSLDELANACHVSRFYLIHVFKESAEMSPIQYSLKLRIERAKELLSDDTLLIKQVAMKVGFEDPFHFSRIFKAIAGASPREFQERIKKTLSRGS